MAKVLLVDGMSLLFRAFYAMPTSMVASDGIPTGALYGFVKLLLKAVDSEKPDKVFVCLDRKEKTFRHELATEYKANRTSPPDELAQQILLLPDMLADIGIVSVSSVGFEADDVIATIATIEEKKGNESIAVTGDQDILQIVSDKTSVLMNKRQSKTDIKYTPELLKKDYGFDTTQFIWYKALKGDPSDNYTGVPGVGEKTARIIIESSKNLDEVKRHPKVAPHIVEFEKALILATIKDTAPFDETKLELPSQIEKEKAVTVFQRFGFKSLVSRFRSKTTGSKIDRVAIDQIPSSAVGDFAVYIEEDEVSFADSERIISVDIGTGMFASSDGAVKGFEKLLKSAGKKVLMSLKSVLKKSEVADPVFDLGLAAHLDDPGSGRYDIKSLKSAYLEIDPPNPRAMLLVAKELELSLAKKNQLDLLNEVEIPLARVLADVEKRGILINKESLAETGKQIEVQISELKKKIFEISGTDFNISSPKQLSHILFEKIGLKPIKKIKTGFSTSAEVLEKLKPLSPIIEYVLRYREFSKLLNTYVKPLPTFADSNGRIHTTFIQNGTSTGRFASANPNLQNIPVRSEWGGLIRSAFIAPDGCMLISADYSQIELRVLAHLSEDKDLVDAFNSGVDVHTFTARKVFGVEEITSEQRRQAKVVNFGILYGMSPHGLSTELGIGVGLAKKIIEDYFNRFKGVKKFIDSVIESATIDGYTETILGRRRYIPELASKSFQIHSIGERLAVNSPIQGSSADIIKLAMLDVEKVLVGTGARQILQIHDELLIECPEEKTEEVAGIVKKSMESILELDIPLIVDVHWGKNWLVAK